MELIYFILAVLSGAVSFVNLIWSWLIIESFGIDEAIENIDYCLIASIVCIVNILLYYNC